MRTSRAHQPHTNRAEQQFGLSYMHSIADMTSHGCETCLDKHMHSKQHIKGLADWDGLYGGLGF